jgi:hypothetical protein
VITGIARAGIDALIELAVEKTPRGRTSRLCDNPQVQEAIGRADTILNAGRAYRSATITEVWNTVAAGEDTTLEQRARCRLAGVYAADCAREAMDLVYRQGGSTSDRRESRLAECWRDLQVVGQAVTVMPEWYPMGGRVFMKMDPGPRLRQRHRPASLTAFGGAHRARVCGEGGLHQPDGQRARAFVAAMLYDTVGPALLATLEPDQFQSTLELNVNFLRPVRPGRVVGKGRVVHRDGDMAFIEASLVDSHGTLIATATATARVIALDRARSAA